MPRSKSALVATLLVSSAAALSALSPVHAQTVASANPTPAPSPAPAPQPAAAAAPGITINGVVEANYTLNFNQPYNGSNTFLYNTKDGQFSVNLADLRISKAATPASRTGFFLRLIDGEVRRQTFSGGDSNSGLPYVLEAYGTFLAPWGKKDIKVDVGQFVTHVGYETVDVGTNNFFSRAFLFQFPSPFYNAGLRAAYPFSDKTTFSLFLLNRFNGNNDTGNRDLAPGFQLAQTFNAKSNIVLNGLFSRDNLGATIDPTGPGAIAPIETNNKQQSILDLIYTNQFTSKFKVVAEGLYRFGKNSDNESYSVTGGALYGIFSLSGGNTFALRGEVVSANKVNNPALPAYPIGILPVESDLASRQSGFSIGTSDKKPRLGSVTASFELHKGFLPNLRTLLEYRLDFAGERFFPGKNFSQTTDLGLKKTQSTITIGQIYSF